MATAEQPLAEPPLAAGDVEAARKHEREPLPETEGAGLDEPSVPLPPARDKPPVILMVVLSGIALALGLGYLAFAFA